MFSLYVADVDECRTVQNLCQSGQCLNTIGSFTCTCPAGYFFDGVRCTFGSVPQPTPPPVSCRVGYVLFNGVCHQEVVIALPCPPGFTYDGQRILCLPWNVTQHICQDGFYFDGRDCIQNPQPKQYCPENYILEDGKCILRPRGPGPLQQPCPKDQTRDPISKQCVPDRCPPGQHTDPETRICKNDPPCPARYYYDPIRRTCVPDGIIVTQPPQPPITTPEEGKFYCYPDLDFKHIRCVPEKAIPDKWSTP